MAPKKRFGRGAQLLTPLLYSMLKLLDALFLLGLIHHPVYEQALAEAYRFYYYGSNR